MATAAKDMWVANLVDPWKGEQSGISVYDFFEIIDEAAEMGRLSTKDKLRLARLKLRGAAKCFYSTQLDLKGDDVEYADFKAAFIQRFKDKQRDQYNYTRLQNASQEKDESPELYLDRLRKLCQTGNPVEQAVLNRKADERLLAAFINGLRVAPGKQLRLQMPGTIDKALNMAIVATNAERAERDHDRDERGPKQRMFAVRGNRGNFQGRAVWSPQNKSQEGGYRVGWGGSTPVQSTLGRGAWRGTRSFRAESRTSVGGGTAPHSVRAGSRTFAEGGTALGPKNYDDRYVRCDRKSIQCYKCGLYGHFRRDCRRGGEGCPGSKLNHPNGRGRAN
jgi:hypothetical protein